MKKVMVFGTFDIIHPGHVYLLEKAKKHGDHLVVIIARDSTVVHVKGKQPIHDENRRLKNMEALAMADTVRLGNIGDKHKVIREEKPDVVVLGYDQKAFTENLSMLLGNAVEIVRLDAYLPEMYKSSKFRAALLAAAV